MFTAYFDAAGNGLRQPFVIVSGYIANSFQWKLFEETWKNAHSEFSVQLPFHMTTFNAARTNPTYKHQTNARQDYVAIASQPEKCEEFFRRLCFAQFSMINCGISCTVPMSIYDEINTYLELREIVPPYALGARTCINRLKKWEGEFAIDSPVEYIFEQGDFEQGKFTDLMIDEGMAAPLYKRKEDSAGLQAADHYAWEQFAYRTQELKTPGTVARGALSLQLQVIPRMHVQPTMTTLVEICHRKGISPRTIITPP